MPRIACDILIRVAVKAQAEHSTTQAKARTAAIAIFPQGPRRHFGHACRANLDDSFARFGNNLDGSSFLSASFRTGPKKKRAANFAREAIPFLVKQAVLSDTLVFEVSRGFDDSTQSPSAFGFIDYFNNPCMAGVV